MSTTIGLTTEAALTQFLRRAYGRQDRDPWWSSGQAKETDDRVGQAEEGYGDPKSSRPQAQPGTSDSDDDVWRLFIAVDLPDQVRGVLSEARNAIPQGIDRAVRWANPEAVHITLRFLGDVHRSRVQELADMVRDAAERSGTFRLSLGEPGGFPGLSRPRVLWIGIEGETERLKRLQARVEGCAVRAGFESEQRKFRPHLTVGRVRKDATSREASDAGRAFRDIPLPSPRPDFPVTEVVLFRSHLGPRGATYERLATCPLGGPQC